MHFLPGHVIYAKISPFWSLVLWWLGRSVSIKRTLTFRNTNRILGPSYTCSMDFGCLVVSLKKLRMRRPRRRFLTSAKTATLLKFMYRVFCGLWTATPVCKPPAASLRKRE